VDDDGRKEKYHTPCKKGTGNCPGGRNVRGIRTGGNVLIRAWRLLRGGNVVTEILRLWCLVWHHASVSVYRSL